MAGGTSIIGIIVAVPISLLFFWFLMYRRFKPIAKTTILKEWKADRGVRVRQSVRVLPSTSIVHDRRVGVVIKVIFLVEYKDGKQRQVTVKKGSGMYKVYMRYLAS